jgi:hypothetical protein
MSLIPTLGLMRFEDGNTGGKWSVNIEQKGCGLNIDSLQWHTIGFEHQLTNAAKDNEMTAKRQHSSRRHSAPGGINRINRTAIITLRKNILLDSREIR